MLATLLAAALLQTTPDPATEAAYATETATIIARAAAEQRCIDLPRPANETVAACTERRMALRNAGNGPPEPDPHMLALVRQRCEGGLQRTAETLPACIQRIRDEDLRQPGSLGFALTSSGPDAAAPDRAPDPQPDRPRCRRRVGGDPQQGSASVSVTCGDPALDGKVGDLLESLLSSSARQ